jgi:hypothetical protein
MLFHFYKRFRKKTNNAFLDSSHPGSDCAGETAAALAAASLVFAGYDLHKLQSAKLHTTKMYFLALMPHILQSYLHTLRYYFFSPFKLGFDLKTYFVGTVFIC